MSEFMESHHPLIHREPKAPVTERLERKVRTLASHARQIGGAIMHHGAPNMTSEPPALELLDAPVDVDPALVAAVNDALRQEAA